MIDDQAVFAGSEEFRETDVPEIRGGFVANFGWPFAEYVVCFDKWAFG
jgi:hypothetical protein